MEQYKIQNAVIEKDLPTQREIVGGTWKKEEEVKGLKSEVVALERKIQLTLSPSKTEAEQERGDGIQQKSEQHELLTKTTKNDIDAFTHNHRILVVKSGLSGNRM